MLFIHQLFQKRLLKAMFISSLLILASCGKDKEKPAPEGKITASACLAKNQRLNAQGTSCVTRCPVGQNASTTTNQCKADINQCGKDRTWNPNAKKCMCNGDMEEVNGQCGCPDGFEMDGGECKPVEDEDTGNPPPKECGADEILVDGECKKKDDGNPSPKECGADEILVDGECKKKDDGNPPPKECGADEILVDGECKKKDDGNPPPTGDEVLDDAEKAAERLKIYNELADKAGDFRHVIKSVKFLKSGKMTRQQETLIDEDEKEKKHWYASFDSFEILFENGAVHEKRNKVITFRLPQVKATYRGWTNIMIAEQSSTRKVKMNNLVRLWAGCLKEDCSEVAIKVDSYKDYLVPPGDVFHKDRPPIKTTVFKFVKKGDVFEATDYKKP